MKNIYQKIADVMTDVAYLAKDDSVETGKGKSYKAITEEKVTSVVRASLIKNGIVILPVKQMSFRTDERVKSWDKYEKREVEKINRITTVDVTYRVQNVEDKDDYIEVQSTGTGVDTQDKGSGKAMTYAYKYMLLRTFAIPTGEDPDKISSDIYTEKLLGEREPEPPAPATNEKFTEFVNAEDKKCSKVQQTLIRQACTEAEASALCKQAGVAALADMTAKRAAWVIGELEKRGKVTS